MKIWIEKSQKFTFSVATMFMIHNEVLNFHDLILYSLLYYLLYFSQQDIGVKINGVIYQRICDI